MTSPSNQVRWTLPASVILHGGLLAAALLVVPHPLRQPVQRVIAVDLVQQGPRPAVPVPISVAEAAAMPAAPVPPATKVESPQDGMIAATDFYAGGILADPANAEVRANFPLLANGEQVVQLCNMEALEQLRLAEPPVIADTLVGYAFDSVSVTDGVLDAEGGAVRSGGRWFHFRYHCAVTPDVAAVSAFAYALGEPIPEDQWDDHFLNANDD